ncbi:sodium:solute symporter [Bacillus capparidis]|uniref:SSS family transporter n=1 Tax=Bacillus capparidis TaxID=1840411 RepID=A0ABS4CWA7_9BACI|nr:sodium:solute symporter [Bacillus capparidis]MBP1081859.1 SSS family transporter [Bacillus capparidis]MED1096508.1 sodium:solute symporter [Bacillus capparidis]
MYLILVGVFATYVGKNQRSTKDYFLGGRKITWWAIGISVMATQAGAITFIGTPGWGYEGGLEQIVTFINVPLVMAFLIVTFVPFFYKSEIYTAYEYLERRFDQKTSTLTSLLFLISRGLATGITLYAPALVLSVITGWSTTITIVLMAVLSIAYTVFGGIRAVIWSDVIQMIVLWFGAVVSLWTIFTLLPGGLGAAMTVASEANLLNSFNFSLDSSAEYTVWAGVIGGVFFHAAYFGADQSQIQRVLTSKSVKESQFSLIFTGIIMVPQMLLFLFIGVLLYVFYSYHGAPHYNDINELFLRFIVNELPTGITGLIIAGVFAAAMSSLDSALNSLSAVTVHDIYKKFFKKKASEAHYLKASRWATIFWGAYAMVFAFFAGSLGPLIEVINQIGSYFYGSLLGAFLLALFTKRANGWGAFIGILAGMAAVFLTEQLVEISWLYYSMIGTIVSVVVGYLISLAGEKPDKAKLAGLTMYKKEIDEAVEKRAKTAEEIEVEQAERSMGKWPFLLIGYFILIMAFLFWLQSV